MFRGRSASGFISEANCISQAGYPQVPSSPRRRGSTWLSSCFMLVILLDLSAMVLQLRPYMGNAETPVDPRLRGDDGIWVKFSTHNKCMNFAGHELVEILS